MSLTCEETPLRWPANVSLDQLTSCSTCGLNIYSQNQVNPLPLTIRTRRDGAGDGVSIGEAPTVSADYRGQHYTLQEAIFHVPGLHVFPGQSDVYPAEYHIHMTTIMQPQRNITVVIPVSHKEDGPGEDYYAAMAEHPDLAITRPLLETLLTPGTQVLQYQGPDIRKRTKDSPTPDTCSSNAEWQFLMVLKPTHIRATDLERIPREGSLNSDPRNLPAPGIASIKKIPTDRLITKVVLADPGILGPSSSGNQVTAKSATVSELECRPLKVVDGHTVVDVSGAVKIGDLCNKPDDNATISGLEHAPPWVLKVVFTTILFLSILISDWLVNVWLWRTIFENTPVVQQWSSIKIFGIFGILVASILNYNVDAIPSMMGSIYSFF